MVSAYRFRGQLSLTPKFPCLWGALLLAAAPAATLAQAPFLDNGQAGFVVSHIEYALGKDAAESGACPDGMTEGYAEHTDVFHPQPDLTRQEGEEDDDFRRRVSTAAMADPNTTNLCQNPELGQPNPRFRTVSGEGVAVHGMDLDGEDSRAGSGGTCPHDDFAGMNGETGVDNQFYRVVGCSNSFQSSGQSNTFAIGMLTGSWGILLTLSDVDDIRNDDSVTVGMYANADPIQLTVNRDPIPYATYALSQDPRFRATARGRIVDGVLTTEQVDANFPYEVNSMYLERPLRDARLRVTLSEDGVLDGYLAGYTDVEALYDVQYGFRNATMANGEEASWRLRSGSSVGQARVQGHTCEGAYYAILDAADGHPDPDTGKCTSVSTQYRITAIPAFVVDAESTSVNDELVR